MPDVPIGDIEAAIRPYGYTAEPASAKHIPLFEQDLHEADKYDLGRTPYQDWRAGLHATFKNPASTFVVSSVHHGGMLVVGVGDARLQGQRKVGLIGLLQTKTYANEAARRHGRAFANHFIAVSKDVIAVFLQHYDLLFNFIPDRQKRNIRWLRQCGFTFFRRRDVETDILFFGQGKNIDEFAARPGLWERFVGAGMYERKSL